MIQRFGFLVISLLSVTLVRPKVYKPCELAQELYKMRSSDVTENLSTLVCVAGYHDFNTSSVRVTPDGVRRYGIFGLPLDRDGYRKSVLGDVPEEAQTFIYNALYVGSQPNSLAVKFYQRICTDMEIAFPIGEGVKIREVKCHLDDYLIGGVAFQVPTNTLELYRRFQFPNITSYT